MIQLGEGWEGWGGWKVGKIGKVGFSEGGKTPILSFII